MKAAILSIGDELLYGEVIDTNAAYVAGKLYAQGIRAVRHHCTGDDESAIADALAALSAEVDVVVATGGLGPTADDVTARAAAAAFGRPLILNDEALEHLQRFGIGKDQRFFPLNQKQALLPAKATIIENPTGTACGFSFRHNGCRLFFLPGVPSEMRPMLDEGVIAPLVRERTAKGVVMTRTFRVFGVSEAELDPIMKEAAHPEDGISVAFCVDFPDIKVLLRGEGLNRQALESAMTRGAARTREILREWLVAEGDDTLDSVVADLFRKTGLKLSLAESCTGGMIASRITDVPGSSAYFLEGAVTYSNEAKSRMLGVPPEMIEREGAVSADVAKAMARGVRSASGSDISVAVTGVAGPDASEAKPAGTVYIALADSAGCTVKKYLFPGDRNQVRLFTVHTALDWLRRYMEKSGLKAQGSGL